MKAYKYREYLTVRIIQLPDLLHIALYRHLLKVLVLYLQEQMI